MFKVFLIIILLNSLIFSQFGNSDNLIVSDDSTQVIDLKPVIKNRDKSVLDVFISLVVPGWSFFKKKEYIKGATFVAIDVAALTGNVYYSYRGDKELERSKEFADTHYSPQKYQNFSDTLLTSNDFLINPNIIRFSDSLGHNIQYDINGDVIKDLNYYEMIGKYDKFVQGWDDVNLKFNDIVSTYGNIYIPQMIGDSVKVYDSEYPNNKNSNRLILTEDKSYHLVHKSQMNSFDFSMMIPLDHHYYGLSNNALYYMGIRDYSNKLYGYADMMLWVIAVNHLTSFGFSIYHMVNDEDKISDTPDEATFQLYPIINLQTQTKGVGVQWSF